MQRRPQAAAGRAQLWRSGRAAWPDSKEPFSRSRPVAQVFGGQLSVNFRQEEKVERGSGG